MHSMLSTNTCLYQQSILGYFSQLRVNIGYDYQAFSALWSVIMTSSKNVGKFDHFYKTILW